MAKKLWGGRFKKKTDPLVEEFTKSIGYDYKLAKYDVVGSILHVQVLRKAGILKAAETAKLQNALEGVLKSMEKGTFKPNYQSEDIHTDIQNILQAKVGGLALKLHAARSRNDQVVFATKLYLKSALFATEKAIDDLADSIVNLLKKNKDIIVPGFTHLQHAQPVLLSDYLSVYTEMLNRDRSRLKYIKDNIKITMGAGALAGTPISASEYKVQAEKVFKEKLMDAPFDIQPTTNSLDAVSDRDFIVETLNAMSILGMHLSRLAEDLIIWSTKEFDFVEIDEAFCTGSSLMPQKKNPDVLELIRGYSGRLNGNLISVLTMMKGLPLTYNRDMQLDKEPLFDSIEIISRELKVLAGLVKTLKFNKKKIEEHLKDESLYATDLAYYLVKEDIPFKDAHTIIGRLIKYSIDNKRTIKEMTQDELNKFSKKLMKSKIAKLFNPQKSVSSKKSINRKPITVNRQPKAVKR